MTDLSNRIAVTNTWLKGIPYEVAFWRNTFRYKKRLQDLLDWSKLGSSLQLSGYDAVDYLASLTKANPIVLDVGCGLSYATGNYDLSGQPLNIHYVDALAPYFNAIKDRYCPQLPNIEFGMMEYLGSFYSCHDVSLIIIQNALDHSANPIKAIIEAIDSLHIGGVLYLNHHPNEAEYEHYRGFHKFNICIEDNHLLIWNKTERYIVDDIIHPFAQISCTMLDGNPIAVITKNADVPNLLLHREQDVQILSSSLIQLSQISNSLASWNALYRKVLFYNLIQIGVQLFPWQVRQRIKNLYNKIFNSHA